MTMTRKLRRSQDLSLKFRRRRKLTEAGEEVGSIVKKSGDALRVHGSLFLRIKLKMRILSTISLRASTVRGIWNGAMTLWTAKPWRSFTRLSERRRESVGLSVFGKRKRRGS